MTVLIPRTRTINVRLSEAEYGQLEQFCVASGARSLSDLVRDTLRSLVQGQNQEPALASSVSENAAQVKELQQRINMLSAEIAELQATAEFHALDQADGRSEAEDVQLSADEEGSPAPQQEKEL